MSEISAKWVCCQLGAREHYAVARALHSRGRLGALITDAWVLAGNALTLLRRSLRERSHNGLKDADVRSANCSLLLFEILARLRGLRGWHLTMTRNRWFQRHAVASLASLCQNPAIHDLSASGPLTVFAYSYAALDIFRWAKLRGWRTVLGQIDPACHEEQLVKSLLEQDGSGLGHWAPAPSDYWSLWRGECALADAIVVNSDWSLQGLLAEGVPAAKLRVIPLAFEREARINGEHFRRVYPQCFTKDRPLRVLFLGQINQRKGVQPLLEAARRLRSEPVEFILVGPVQIQIPDDLANSPSVRWLGPVSRQATARFYREADVFIFPTLSDGFGLTQLEAQAWQLPVIASRYCGEVVIHGVNGVRLKDVNGPEIANVLRSMLTNPQVLREYAERSTVDKSFSLTAIGNSLLREL